MHSPKDTSLTPSKAIQSTKRTARSRTSGEKRFDFLFMAPSSQSLEPPQKPGRFNLGFLAGYINLGVVFQLNDLRRFEGLGR